jgi:hypothetical protein
MIKCSVRYSKARVAFKDLPVSTVFRFTEGNDYIYLKTDDAKISINDVGDPVVINAVRISTGALRYLDPESLVEELYNVELLYDTIP